MMLFYLIAVAYLSTSSVLAPEPYETKQLLEQYEQNAQQCDSISCTDEELDGLDRDLLMLLGRRAAILRQRSRITAASQNKGQLSTAGHSIQRMDWLGQKAKELNVPHALAQPILQALIQASQAYENQRFSSR